jgi:hypothetical protein
MSKSVLCSGAAFALLVLTGSVSAADQSDGERKDVSASTLADLGLAGLQPISDRQGRQVRGRAFEGTPGNGSFTTLPTMLRKDGLGVIEHGAITGGGYTTTIVNHPQLGTVTLPPQLKK